MSWGNCSSMRYIPVVRGYAHALRLLNTTKPIAGSGPNAGRIPLGSRKDIGKYYIRAGVEDSLGADVEFVLYDTPVVTYKPDGRIVIGMDRWNSNTTRQFISAVLGASCHAKSGVAVLDLGQEKSLIPPNERVVLRSVQAETANQKPTLTFDAESKLSVTGYAIKRQKANNVRRKYAEFIWYMRGAVSLRKINKELAFYHTGHMKDTYEAVEFEVREAADVLGVAPATSENGATCGKVRNAEWKLLHDKPQPHLRPRGYNTYAGWIAAYNAKCEEYIALITTQDAETKHTNFYKALMIMMCIDYNPLEAITEAQLSRIQHIGAGDIEAHFDKMIKMYHAEDILEPTTMQDGVVPNKTYVDWMWMHSPELVAKAEAQEVIDKKRYPSAVYGRAV